MPEVISLGPVAVDGVLAAAVLSIVGGIAVLTLWIRFGLREKSDLWAELWVRAALIAAVIWKFGFVWRDPSVLWERPEALLMMRGGMAEACVGAAIAACYLYVAISRRKMSLPAFLDASTVALATGLMFWNILTELPYRLAYALLCIVLLISLIRHARSHSPGRGEMLRLFLSGMGLGGLLISLFAAPPPSAAPMFMLGLTGVQWLFMAHALLSVFAGEGAFGGRQDKISRGGAK